MMMQSLILRLVVVLSVWGQSSAESIKTADVVVLSNLATSIDFFTQNHGGNLPLSWLELENSGYAPASVIDSAERTLNITNAYRFPKNIGKINIRGEVIEIVVMAVAPDVEGSTVKSDGQTIPGRRVIVRQSDGRVHARKYSEGTLKIAFSDAGFSLNDFTGKSGNWNAADESNEDIPEKHPDLNNLKAGSSIPSPEGNRETDDGTLPEKLQFTSWVVWPSVGLLIVAIGVIFLRRKKTA